MEMAGASCCLYFCKLFELERLVLLLIINYTPNGSNERATSGEGDPVSSCCDGG